MAIDRKLLVSAGGKLLVSSGGKLADPACCCGETNLCGTPDDAPCLRYINFQFKVDQSEVDAGGLSGDLVELYNAGEDVGFGIYADYDGRNWYGYGTELVGIPMADGSPANIWHDAQLVLTSDGETITAHFCIDGVVSEEWTETGPATIDEVIVGSRFVGAISHHSIRNITFFSGADTIFAFPPTAFDSTTGTTISTSGGVVRVDNDTTADVYATKVIDPAVVAMCPAVFLECDSISASKNKCGRGGFRDGALNWWKKLVGGPGSSGPFYSDPTGDPPDSFPTSIFRHYQCTDVGSGTCSGTVSCYQDFAVVGGICGPNSPTCDGGSVVCGGTTYTSCHEGQQNTGIENTNIVSDEWTTEQLIDDTIAALPAYDDDFADACAGAYRLLTSDGYGHESSYTIRRFIPRFGFSPSPTPIAFTINYNERFTTVPAWIFPHTYSIGDLVYHYGIQYESLVNSNTSQFPPLPGDPDTAWWARNDVDPSAVDTPRSLDVNIGDTEALGPEVLEPDDNGTIWITDIMVV